MNQTNKTNLALLLKILKGETIQGEITRESSATVDCCVFLIETISAESVGCSTKKRLF